METKSCVCCGKVLPIEKFGKNRHTDDGYMMECRECHNFKQRAAYHKRKNAISKVLQSTPAKTESDNVTLSLSLASFSIDDLISELRTRGCSGEIHYTQNKVF